MKVFLFFSLVFLVMLGMVLMNFLFMVVSEEKWKMSSLEAGFISTGNMHKTYSLQFFFLLIIFVVFDLEILMIFSFFLKTKTFIVMNFAVVIFLFITLLLEWKWSKLLWVL